MHLHAICGLLRLLCCGLKYVHYDGADDLMNSSIHLLHIYNPPILKDQGKTKLYEQLITETLGI